MSVKLRSELDVLRSQLFNERSTFEPHWRDIGDYILPRRPRFFVTDVNKGDRRNQKIIDSTAHLAARTLASGMMSGITSPSRPWFRLSTGVRELDDSGEVKRWLDNTRNDMLRIFNKSNLYNILPVVYGDLGTFGTAPMLIEEDITDNVVHFRSFPVGSYFLGLDEKGRVSLFMREFVMTSRQIIEKFATDPVTGRRDFSNISSTVRRSFENGHTEQYFYITHVIRNNPDHDPRKDESKFKKFQSIYYEQGLSKQFFNGQNQGSIHGKIDGRADNEKILRNKGYDFFPVFAPRWSVTGEDVYGTDCPGMTALGDAKALYVMHKRKAQALEKKVNPPLVGPSSLKNKVTSQLPGDVTYLDENQSTDRLRPLHEVNFQISELVEDMRDHRERISRSFFEDLFLMLARSDRRQITAREIEERHEEKLLALGPVLEQLNQDLLDPLVDATFTIMNDRDMIDPAPEELQGVDLKVEYISVMAQAQKTIGVSSVERFVGFVGNIAGFDPTAADKLNINNIIDKYGDMVSVDPHMVRTDEEVEAIREQRAQAQAQAQQSEMLKQSASAAKDLAQAQVGEEGGNVLDLLTGA